MTRPAIDVTLTRNEQAVAAPGMLQRIRAATPAHTVIRQFPGYAPTPTVWLPALAQALRVRAIAAKDEGCRFGLGSFKSVGAGYAVYRQIAAAVAAVAARDPGLTELLAGVHASSTRDLLLVCASAGNHGRAVAWAARLFHCRCRVFLSDTVPEERVAAIRAEGGEVVRMAADYDTCVRHVATEARRNGWLVISDTAYDGYEAVPVDIMRGYTIIIDEYLREAPLPTHVFVQAGVGGLAAAVAAAFTGRNDDAAPRIIVVEPEHAACIAASMRRGARTEVAHAHSIMGGLACGVASAAAWEALAATDAFSVTIPDAAVAPVSEMLRTPAGGDPPLRAGPSGCAGLAALIGCAANADVRASLGIDEDARVLTFVTERG